MIANTIKAEPPPGFQTTEFMLERGFVDRIVPRADRRREIVRIIDHSGKYQRAVRIETSTPSVKHRICKRIFARRADDGVAFDRNDRHPQRQRSRAAARKRSRRAGV